MGRDPVARLEDMRDAILASYRLVKGMDRRRLEGNEAVYFACQNRILVVAEAAKGLPASLRGRHGGINWGDLIKMGDKLRHQYFRIESDIVWDTVKRDFPVLLRVVDALLEDVASVAG